MEISPRPASQAGTAEWFTGHVWFDVLAVWPAPLRRAAIMDGAGDVRLRTFRTGARRVPGDGRSQVLEGLVRP